MQLTEKYLIRNEVEFIMWNILIILVSSVVYFVIKEFSRVKGGKVSNYNITIIGIFVGILLLLVSIFVNYQLDLRKPVAPDLSTPYGIMFLNPSILYLIFFGVFIDRRLTFTMLPFLLLATLLKALALSPDSLWKYQLIDFSFDSLVLIILSTIIIITQNKGVFKKVGPQISLVFVSLTVLITLFGFFSILIINSISNEMEFNKFVILLIFLFLAELTFLLTLFLIQWFIFILIERVYRNFSKLETFSTHDDVSYYKLSLAQEKLRNIINEKKIEKGILAIFDFKAEGDEITNILKKIETKTKKLYKNTFFFKVSSNHYGAFYEVGEISNFSLILKNNKLVDRVGKDPLLPLSNELKLISNELEVNINSTASIYGVHSSDINELLEYNKFLMIPDIESSNDNNVIVYDFKRVKSSLREKFEVTTLPTNLNNLKISFIRGVSEKEIYYPSISFGKNSSDRIFNIIEGLNEINNVELLLRFASYQSLRKFNKPNATLVVYCSSTLFEKENFIYKDFNKKTKKFLPNEKVIVGLLVTDIINIERFKWNMEILRENNYELCVINPETINQEQIDFINPEYILSVNDEKNAFLITKKKLLIETQATRLNSNLV